MKIKTQAVEPDTCEPPGCRYYELWDVDLPENERTFQIAAYERMCPAHFDPDIPQGVMQWVDGNWKPLNEYIEYQRAWFRRLNFIEWEQNHPEQPKPPQIAGYTSDPVTTGSLPAPAANKIAALNRVHGWVKGHNARKNQAITMPRQIKGNIDESLITWSYSGVGDSRVLTVNCGGQLTANQRNNAQNLADTAFGIGKVVVIA